MSISQKRSYFSVLMLFLMLLLAACSSTASSGPSGSSGGSASTATNALPSPSTSSTASASSGGGGTGSNAGPSHVYVGATDGTVYSVNALTGAKEWQIAVGGLANKPVVVNGIVYVATDAGTCGGTRHRLNALERDAGRLI